MRPPVTGGGDDSPDARFCEREGSGSLLLEGVLNPNNCKEIYHV